MENHVLNWLLEKENPAVRYATLTTFLDAPINDKHVVAAQKMMMEGGPIRALLDVQSPEGWWTDPYRYYLDKYRGTVWSLLILAHLGADSSDTRIRNACEFLFTHAMDEVSVGFSVESSRRDGKALKRLIIPCLTGNMVYTLIKLGFGDDHRTHKAINWICRYQRTDDGAGQAPSGDVYARNQECWGNHTCHMGVAKALKGLAAIPEEKRSPTVQHKIEELVHYFLIHHIYKKSHDLKVVSKPNWTKFGYPLMYQSDALELLDIMASLPGHAPQLEDAITLVENKRTGDGIWLLENSYSDRFLIPLERKKEPSKWVTLRALRVLKTYRGA